MSRYDSFRPANGLLVHAGAVIVSGKALLFLGHSGAGKSTICKLLSERFPILSDDLVRLTRNDDGIWHTSDIKQIKGRNSSNTFPLGAILRIYQSKVTQLTAISPQETCRYLMDAVVETIVDEQPDLFSIRNWFSYGGEISRKHSGWKLAFPLNSEVIDVIRIQFKSQPSV